MFKHMHMPVTQPVVENKWGTEEAENVNSLFATYAKAKLDFDEASKQLRTRETHKEWQKCELAHRGTLVQLMIGLVGLQEYARIRGYQTR